MRILRMTIILPTMKGKTVTMDKEMTQEEIENFRAGIIDTFNLYGFAGALVELTTFEGPIGIDPLFSAPEAIIEPKSSEPISHDVAEFQPVNKIRGLDYFKKLSHGTN